MFLFLRFNPDKSKGLPFSPWGEFVEIRSDSWILPFSIRAGLPKIHNIIVWCIGHLAGFVRISFKRYEFSRIIPGRHCVFARRIQGPTLDLVVLDFSYQRADQ